MTEATWCNLRRTRMARRNISYRKHKKRFNRAQRNKRAINTPLVVPRGGIRL